jgi:predicted nuclease with TOPRIM domain
MENNNYGSKIDVRIIVSNLDIAGLVSKAVDSIQLERDYNIVVSSIIPTTDLEIAKKVAEGADIILIGGYGQDDNFNLLFNDLKTDFNHIGLFDYNNVLFESEDVNAELAQKEILNSIIKSTLSYSLNLINIHTLENKLLKITHNYNSLLDDYNKLIKENEVLSMENNDLHSDINNLKSDFSNFKNRYEDIYSKDFLEIYRLEDLWAEIFNQDLIDEQKIVIATNKFRPDNIIVGQGYIAAQSRNHAIEWLKIIKTALIFVEDNEEELKKELSSNRNEKPPEARDDYDLPNTFENFWD